MRVQIQNEDGVWNTWTASSYDWGEIYNNDDTAADRQMKFKILNENTSGFGGDLVVNELCAKETYQTNCFGTTPVGDFEIENQVNSETVVPAGSALTLTLKYNPFWNNSGKASDAIDIKYSTNAPEFVDGEVEVSATTVRPKLWVNDVPNGGGTILQTDFFDYDERTTAFNFGVQNIYDSSTREFHLRNHGGYTNGSFPNQSYNNWGNLEIKSIEIEGAVTAYSH